MERTTALGSTPEPSSRAERAEQYFYEGYNCSQSIVLAFADLFDCDRQTLLSVASSFGAGMGRLREVCGAVSGMFIVMGLLSGYATPETGDIKTKHYANIQTLAKRFEEKNGSIICRELLGLKEKRDDPIPEPRTASYYKKRPCPQLIACAADILDTFIKEGIQSGDFPPDLYKKTT